MADRAVRILLVDDEPPIQTLLSYPLQKDGYEVITAADGRQALERFEEITPDLVVLDVMMPKMDGLEVARRLKADPATASIPILLLSAKAQEVDVRAGSATGADDYLTKPFDPLDLLERVEALIAKQ